MFDFIYSEENKKKFVSQPKDYNDISILKNLKENVENNTTKEKKDKTCDEVFYEYLHFFKEKTNEEFYTLMIKFIENVLIIIKIKEKKQIKKKILLLF